MIVVLKCVDSLRSIVGYNVKKWNRNNLSPLKPIKMSMLDNHFLTAVEVVTKPEGYEYGAVAAPGNYKKLLKKLLII